MTSLNKAKEYLQKGYSICVYKDDEPLLSKGKGISFIAFLARDKVDVRGASVADKIVGSAAAHIYALLGVKEVYAEVLSVGGQQILAEANISCSYDTLATEIINRQGTGLCPMEQAVFGISNHSKALDAVLNKINELKSK